MEISKLLTKQWLKSWYDKLKENIAYSASYETGNTQAVIIDQETGEHTYGEVHSVAEELDVLDDKVSLLASEYELTSDGLDKILTD